MTTALHVPRRGPLARRRRDELPADRTLPAVYRLLDESSDWLGQGELARDAALSRIEAALFASDEPLTARRLSEIAGIVDTAGARRLVRKLQDLYDRDGTSFQVDELAGGFQLLTRPQYQRWLVRQRRADQELRLTAPARETLAIV